MQEIMNENARIVAGTPDTLAEELACRWADEPLLVQRVANHIWAWAYGSPRKPWYWNHGIDPELEIGVMSMAWELRQKSLHAGALSHRQARETRALALSRYPHPRIRRIAEHSMIPLQTFPAALQCRSPDAASFEAALLDDSGEVVKATVGPYDHDRGSITGLGDVGPIPYGTDSATIRYTLLDAAGNVVDRHTVRYQIEFSFTLEEFEALPRKNRNLEWVTQIAVAEVNGTPVEKPRLP